MIDRTMGPAAGASAAGDGETVCARVLIVSAPYYADISQSLLEGATAELDARGATYELVEVAGALEIPQAVAAAADAGLIPREPDDDGEETDASADAEGLQGFDGVIALGCVIRGETSHYDVVVGNANHWLMQIAIDTGTPLGNAILTVDTQEQAVARASGGRSGKGGDAARACLGLIALRRQFGSGNS